MKSIITGKYKTFLYKQKQLLIDVSPINSEPIKTYQSSGPANRMFVPNNSIRSPINYDQDYKLIPITWRL